MPVSDIPDDVAVLAGPQLFGHLFNYGLFGILTVQVYYYHLSFPRDPLRLKILIYALYILECVQIIMATHDAYQVLGAGWGDPDALTATHWSWFDTPVMTGIVSATVQFYFSWRIYVLSTSALLSGSICLIALVQACAAIATGAITRIVDNNDDVQDKMLKPLVIWLVGSATCDIIIAVSMLILLSRNKHGTANDALISRLIRLTVETGSMTASVTCLDLILFVAFRHKNLYMTPALVLTKVYANTMLLLVNSRIRLRSMMLSHEMGPISRPLQWVIDHPNNDGDEDVPAAEPRTSANDVATWKVPIIDMYTNADGEEAKLGVAGASRAASPRSSHSRVVIELPQ